jgi:hypothetical protein
MSMGRRSLDELHFTFQDQIARCVDHIIAAAQEPPPVRGTPAHNPESPAEHEEGERRRERKRTNPDA